MLAGVIEVEVHLASVRIAELPNFEVRNKQAPQAAMKENEVNTEPIVVDAESTLAAKEGEIITQLQQEVSEVLNERRFQVGF
jgi:hypothetical protein